MRRRDRSVGEQQTDLSCLIRPLSLGQLVEKNAQRG